MTTTEIRAKAVKLAKSRLKKNRYTQGNDRGYVWGKPEGKDPGYSDCSSFTRAVIKKASGVDIGYNTSGQIQNRAKGLLIEDNRGGKRSFPTLSKLLPGDCIYYKGNSSHAWGVGHVEMAISQTQCIGHGGGTGPNVHNIKSYSKGRTGAKKYLCVIRWILDDDDQGTPEPEPEDNAGKYRVNCDLMNVRKGPGTHYDIVKTVKRGAYLTPVAHDGWVPVLVDGLVRWVSIKYLEGI